MSHGPHVHPVLLAVAKAFPNKAFGLRRHGRLVGELDLGGLQDSVLLKDGSLYSSHIFNYCSLTYSLIHYRTITRAVQDIRISG